MTLFRKMHYARRRPARLAAFAVVCAAVCVPVAMAQTEDSALSQAAAPTPPYALFEYSTLTGSGSTITANWVPVVTSSGTFYKNVTLLFNLDSSGNLTLASGYPKVVPSPTPLVSSFVAGKYVGPSTVDYGNAVITVSGPGITAGGATEWSLAAAAGANAYTYPSTSSWYVGPIASNPLAARLNAAGITSTAWSYGVGVGCYCTSGGGGWYFANALLGFSQTANALTIVSFTDDTGKDHSQPVSQITYTLAP
jgi:hypothetical protein